MRRLSAIVVFLLFIFLLLGAGCGGKKVTVRTEEGKVEVSEKSGEVKLKSEKGEASISKEKITEEDLGVPIYPGAAISKDGSASVKSRTEKGESVFMAATFVTEDSIDEVTEWYRSKLSGKQNFMDLSSTVGGKKSGMFMFQEGNTAKTVTITAGEDEHKGKTLISISSGTATP